MLSKYVFAHEDEINLDISIEWSKPCTHDMLHYGLEDSNDSAYFYAIIGICPEVGGWWAYYIGMVYSQDVSSRHLNKDHQKKLEYLKTKYPDITWHLTLGTPLGISRINKQVIEEIEGLLIYSHWHKDLLNEKKVNSFNSNKAIRIKNTGFVDPFYRRVAYGVMLEEWDD